MKNIFEKFTNQYSLSKTLRFELKPVGKTQENVRKHLMYDKDLQTFLKDQEIEDSYQILKPVMDKIHETFITISLKSEKAKEIDFSQYLEIYKKEKGELKKPEDNLRKQIGELFSETAKQFKYEYKNTDPKTGDVFDEIEPSEYQNKKSKKGLFKKENYELLSENTILRYLEINLDTLAENETEKTKIKKALEKFKRFFTYFGGYNQNRENYYETKEEKATAVATRIVHENLPKFCDNAIQFEYIIKKKKNKETEKMEEERISRKEEYKNTYQYLKDNEKTTQIKDAKSGKMVEATAISENIFKIDHFTECLTQYGIEEYNRIIGHYNLLINLYNQAKRAEEKDLEKNKKTFKDLPKFKTLWKQIGCGKKKALFFTLTHDKKIDAVKARSEGKEAFSVEEVLLLADEASKKYFQGKRDDGVINTVPEFREYVLGKENYDGVYWSKAAMNTISNKYFANYHDLKDRLKNAKVFQKPNKGSEEDVKIPEAIELSGLFNVLNETNDWQKEEIIFRESLMKELEKTESNEEENKKRKERKKIITQSKTPSEALLKMIFVDIEENEQQFLDSANATLELKDYKSKESKEMIKQWMDCALAVNQMLKYFQVKESKVKGEPVDPVITEALNVLLRADDAEWFRWYDAIRNYLTKKPQDDAKKNKLKLNFENSTLAWGWDVNKESSNTCVLLQDQEGKKFLAVMKKNENTLFQKEWVEGRGKKKITKQNPLYYVSGSEVWNKMDYDFWSDVSKMVPKCSTQLKKVINHFKNSNDDFVFPVGYKITSGERFSEECKITKKEYELNNKVYKKDNILAVAMRHNLSDEQEKQYVKTFQKEYWKLLLKKENPTREFSNQDFFVEWKNFCKKNYSELSNVENIYKDALIAWINFCKNFLARYPKTKLFEYSFKETEDYNSIDEFYLDVDICSYKLKIDTKINKPVLDRLVDEGRIYLFKIKNQDLNDGKKDGHKNNLHTIYWNTIFQEINNRPKLNGEAEIFYRKAIPVEKLEKVDDRKGKDGNNVIKNFRFSKEKFIFHVPITLNFCLDNSNLDGLVNNYFSKNYSTYFLGIDRGEKHLAYYSLVDQSGKIVDQGTLNLPFADKNGNKRSIKKDKYFYDKKEGEWESKLVDCWDYNDLLDAMSSNRDMARKNWQTIGTIKELKAGYVSQVVRKIADLATTEDKPTFIVLEDLNTGFKRGRQKIEKSVYQKLELALAKKLNFLVDKNAKTGEIGSVTKAIQLTPLVNNYSDIENKKQVGIMLYTRANYTSQTDPLTGWRKTIYLKTGSEESIKYQIIGNRKTEKDEIKPAFSDIRFDGKDYVFVYIDKNTGKKWELYSGINGENLDRFRGKRGEDKYEWKVEPINVKEILDGVFANFDKNKSLLKQMRNGTELVKINEHTAWESLRFAIDLIQQIRNTGKDINDRDDDFILSPVRDGNGKHFDSREYWDKEQKKEKIDMPTSGDANGAFNIARKGLLMNAHIKENSDSKDLNLFISDEEWDLYLADKEAWKKQLPKFSLRKMMEKEKTKPHT